MPVALAQIRDLLWTSLSLHRREGTTSRCEWQHRGSLASRDQLRVSGSTVTCPVDQGHYQGPERDRPPRTVSEAVPETLPIWAEWVDLRLVVQGVGVDFPVGNN